MEELAQRIARLSPEQRETLLRWLAERGTPPPAATARLPALVPDPGARFTPFPLTAVQEAYLAGRSGLYDLGAGGSNIYQALELLGPFAEAMARLRRAWERLIARHDMLRVVIETSPRGVMQRVLPEVPRLRIAVQDLRRLGPEAAAESLACLRDELCARTARIDRWPLFDVVAQRLGEERILLHTRFETFLMDGEARMQLMRELFQLFEDPGADLPAAGCTYRDFALAWRRVQATSPLYRDAREHWRQRLASLPPAPRLPAARGLTPGTPPARTRRAMALAAESWRRLKQRGARAGLTPSTLLLAAYAEVVARWSGTQRFTLCTVGSYRPPLHADILQVVGNFNTISLLEVDGRAASWEARARRIQERNAGDLERPYFSGFEVLRALNRERGASSNAAFPVWFNSVVEYSHPTYLEEMGSLAASAGGCTLYLVDMIWHPPQCSLLGTAFEGQDGSLVCSWQAVTAAFPPGLCAEMSAAGGRLLQRLALDEELWTSPRVPLLPEDERPPATGESAVRVLDARLERCPVWVPGEVWVGEPHASRGHWQGRALSAEPGGALRPTGLVGRRLPGGGLDLLGPVAEVEATVLGYRVELPLVERRLAEHPTVQAAAVLGPRDAERWLRAFVVAAPGRRGGAPELAAHVGAALPYYMVPGEFVFLPEMPRRPDGFPDRTVLGRRVADGAAAAAPAAANAALCAALASIWEELLGCRPARPEDDFFALGGDSISAVELTRRVREELGQELSLGALFRGRTVRAMASSLEGGTRP